MCGKRGAKCGAEIVILRYHTKRFSKWWIDEYLKFGHTEWSELSDCIEVWNWI